MRKTFEDKLNEAFSTVLNEAFNRRTFLNRVGKVASTVASGGGPLKTAGKIALGGLSDSTNKWADIPDEELKLTDERKWMEAIPFSRLTRIMQDRDYAGGETMRKLYELMVYGSKSKQGDVALSMMINSMKKVGISTKDIESMIGKQMMTSDLMNYTFNNPGESASIAFKELEKVGISLPEAMHKMIMKHDIRATQHRQNAEAERNANLKKKQDRANDNKIYGNPMHQTFESKLDAALMSILNDSF